MRPPVFPAPPFPDHALLDSGEAEKLERFGPVVLRRPDPQALWRRRLPEGEWAGAHLTFERESDRGGRWIAAADLPIEAHGLEPSWTIGWEDVRCHVRPTPFKHVGLFPEQAANWDYLRRAAPHLEAERPKLLNLFGYTGMASIVAAHAGYEVTHVDASKTAIGWTRENAEASALGRRALRVLCDDALAFARREVRRGSRYHGILLDPPHYGRGPKGEVWRLEEGLAPLVEAASRLLAERAFLVLSTYAVGYSPLAFANLLSELEGGAVAAGELALREEPLAGRESRLLPAGFCARWARGVPLEEPA